MRSALAVLFLLVIDGALSRTAAAAGRPPAAERVVVRLSNIDCSGCAKAVRASLRELDGVSAAEVSERTKRAVVTYDGKQVTVQQLAEAVAATRPLRGKPYSAALLIRVEPLNRATASRLASACTTVNGITLGEVDEKTGVVAVVFARLKSAEGAAGPAGVPADAVLQAIRAAGFAARLVTPEKP
jgi:copper chaperone CopZ